MLGFIRRRPTGDGDRSRGSLATATDTATIFGNGNADRYAIRHGLAVRKLH